MEVAARCRESNVRRKPNGTQNESWPRGTDTPVTSSYWIATFFKSVLVLDCLSQAVGMTAVSISCLRRGVLRGWLHEQSIRLMSHGLPSNGRDQQDWRRRLLGAIASRSRLPDEGNARRRAFSRLEFRGRDVRMHQDRGQCSAIEGRGGSMCVSQCLTMPSRLWLVLHQAPSGEHKQMTNRQTR
jgi:hypothetical protein